MTVAVRSYEPAKMSAALLHDILTASRSCHWVERRAHLRHPCFMSAILKPVDAPQTQVSIFTREISRSGIGLLHFVRFEPGTLYRLEWPRQELGSDLLVEVLWCEPSGDGWYASGCRFVS
jgi:hypothetical protein